MQKELVICIIIVIAIIVVNIFTHNNTKLAVAEMNESLENVSTKILESEKDNKTEESKEGRKSTKENSAKDIEEEIENSKEIWNRKYQSLAYYIEHDELEKVSEALIKAKSNIKAEEYNTAIENINSCIFLLQHIEEKDKFTLKNIF